MFTQLVALTLLAVTNASDFPFFFRGSAVPQFYGYTEQMVAAPVTDKGKKGVALPCRAEGFYAHPLNCSRFYRCVDYAGTGQVFSRYEFQCPRGQMFLTVGKNTCVPGDCAGVVSLPPVPEPEPEPAPAPAVAPVGAYPPIPPTVVADYPSVSPVVIPQPVPVSTGSAQYPQGTVTVPVPIGVGQYPQGTGSLPGSQIGGGSYPPPVAETPASTVPAIGGQVGGGAYPTTGSTAEAPATVDAAVCPLRFVQHPKYCNVYQLCTGEGDRYVCTAGSVFDQDRQMCRLNSRADDVCLGKSFYEPSRAFRSSQPFVVQQTPVIGHGQQFYQVQPTFSQGQIFHTVNQGQTFPSISQGQSFPSSIQGQSFPSFSQGQTFPSFSQGQTFPSFSQGQTFPSFSQGQTPTFTYFNQPQSISGPSYTVQDIPVRRDYNSYPIVNYRRPASPSIPVANSISYVNPALAYHN